ncbi:hypothetical protein CDD83_620 [Cordyceps sp. RAO-2017]|nr:hypothetical protein CDD83_620 [Cordyceps sp. RAO-2017]
MGTEKKALWQGWIMDSCTVAEFEDPTKTLLCTRLAAPLARGITAQQMLMAAAGRQRRVSDSTSAPVRLCQARGTQAGADSRDTCTSALVRDSRRFHFGDPRITGKLRPPTMLQGGWGSADAEWRGWHELRILDAAIVGILSRAYSASSPAWQSLPRGMQQAAETE